MKQDREACRGSDRSVLRGPTSRGAPAAAAGCPDWACALLTGSWRRFAARVDAPGGRPLPQKGGRTRPNQQCSWVSNQTRPYQEKCGREPRTQLGRRRREPLLLGNPGFAQSGLSRPCVASGWCLLERPAVGFRSVVVITFASHAKGPRFDPGREHTCVFARCSIVKWHRLFLTRGF